MLITVRFHDWKWKVDPDPAIVRVGEPVTWLVRWPRSPVARVRWAVYFSPFSDLHRLAVTTVNTHLGAARENIRSLEDELKSMGVDLDDASDHQGAIGPVIADKPGEYKYGISAANAETGEKLDDEDPKLIVH